MFDEEKINNIKVKPIVVVDSGEQKIKGGSVFNLKNWIAFISARKKSGKSSLIANIINQTTSKKTTIWLFCSTYKIDKTWIEVIKNLEEKGYIVNCFDSIVDGAGKKSVDNLQIILDDLAQGKDSPVEKEPEPELRDRFGLKVKGMGQMFKEEVVKKPKKPKIHVSSNLFILDDVAQQLKLPSVERLCKTHRHSDSNIIISSQYAKDLLPSCITQIDFLIMFKGFQDDKVEHLHRILDLSIPFELFNKIYKHCVEEPYSFMVVDVRTERIRKNFNTMIKYKI